MLLSPLLTKEIQLNRMTSELQHETKFTHKKWIYVFAPYQGQIAEFQSYMDLGTLLGKTSN